jgi:hypothetical protein
MAGPAARRGASLAKDWQVSCRPPPERVSKYAIRLSISPIPIDENPTTMKTRHLPSVRGALSLLLLSALIVAVPVRAAGSAVNEDGLVKATVKGVDRVLQRPGTDWSTYTKVLLAPVDVSFSRSWSPRDYGAFGLKAGDVDRIRRELALMTQDIFGKVLAEGGYTLVQTPAEGVLQVRPNIVNLYINAPDNQDAGRTRSYVIDAGEMTLALELRDSVTGTLLAQARDRKRGTENGRVALANSVMNRVEAERALRGWALQLRSNLDAARKSP